VGIQFLGGRKQRGKFKREIPFSKIRFRKRMEGGEDGFVLSRGEGCHQISVKSKEGRGNLFLIEESCSGGNMSGV